MSTQRFSKLILAGIVSIVTLFASSLPASAAGVSVTYYGFVGSCSTTGTTIFATGNATGAATFNGNVQVGSNAYHYTTSVPAGTFPTSFSATFSNFPGWPPSIPLPYTFDVTIAVNGGAITEVTINCHANGTFSVSVKFLVGAANFTDGRCNQEPWQSFAVYSDGKGGYNFYALYNGVGYFAMHVTEQNLDDNPDTGVNHRIAEAKGVQLYRLKGGLLQAHRIGANNKDYSYNITCGIMED